MVNFISTVITAAKHKIKHCKKHIVNKCENWQKVVCNKNIMIEFFVLGVFPVQLSIFMCNSRQRKTRQQGKINTGKNVEKSRNNEAKNGIHVYARLFVLLIGK